MERCITSTGPILSQIAHDGFAVIGGVFQAGEIEQASARKILSRRGDVLLIRPLVAHNSLSSQPGNQDHRRILHLEFAARRELPAGYEWHDFVTARETQPPV